MGRESPEKTSLRYRLYTDESSGEAGLQKIHFTAEHLLNLYRSGERDFRNIDLQGCKLSGQDLSGADFSGSDIRSTDFSNARLHHVNLSNTTGGAQQYWTYCQVIIILLSVFLSSLLVGYIGAWIGYMMNSIYPGTVIAGLVSIVTITVNSLIVSQKGFTFRALGYITIVFIFAFVFTFFSAGTFLGAGAFAVAVAFIGSGTLAVTVAISTAANFINVFGKIAVAISLVAATITTVGLSRVGSLAGAGSLAAENDVGEASIYSMRVIYALVFISFLLSIHISKRIYDRSDGFGIIVNLSRIILTIGGTNFSGADLTNASFVNSYLGGAYFADSSRQSTILTHVLWRQAKRLNWARVGSSILSSQKVRELLVSHDGSSQDFSSVNLRGANLKEAKLTKANFKRAILSEATLENADLGGSNLSEVQAVGTDFTGSHLTGVCLEGWNIDSTTILSRVDCQYVFLLEKPNSYGDYERRPHNPEKNFQPGDFEKFFKEILDTVQILIRNGVDSQAFSAAFKKLMEDHPGVTHDSIKSIEKQGQDVMLTLQVPKGTDKAKLEQDWDTVYYAKLEAAKAQARLETEQKWAIEMKMLLEKIAQPTTTIINQAEIKQVEGNDYSQQIKAGGDINVNATNRSTINLRDISGQVTNTLNQLSSPASSTQPSLKDLLSQLQVAIEHSTELSEDDKTDALVEVGQLGKIGQSSDDLEKKKLARRPLNVLKGITLGLSEASELAAICKELLPQLMTLFGL